MSDDIRIKNLRKSIVTKTIITACTVGQIISVIAGGSTGIGLICVGGDRVLKTGELVDTLSYLKDGDDYHQDISSKISIYLELLQ